MRFPRLLELLDVERVKMIIYNRLREIANANEDSFPIIKAFMQLMFFRILRLTFIVFTCSFFVGIFWMIFTCDLQPAPSKTGLD